MQSLDYVSMGIFFFVLVAIGVWGNRKIKNADDYYVGGGKVPWWLSGISHHVSGYSAVVFTGYAAIAYSNGVSIYLWWAVTIAAMVFIGSYLIAPRWARLHEHLGFTSPTTYLSSRYGLATQQVTAWSGVILKLLDVGAKWVAIGVILKGFLGLDLWIGILVGSCMSMIYMTIGGMWADLANDFFQFIVQLLTGIIMLVGVVIYLGGWSGFTEAWTRLPELNRQFFRAPYSVWYTIFYAITIFMSYNGGTWNLAMRFMSSPSAKEAQKSARLSAVLYLIWPIVLFLPMWISPIIFPNLEDPGSIYSLMAGKFVPAGLYGIVLVGMLAATLAMTGSDVSAVSAVINEDILPVVNPKKFKQGTTSLVQARIVTVLFNVLTVIIALNNERFGGITGLIITWFGALLGPSAMPMLLGLLPAFKKCDQKAAITTILAGFATFIVLRFVPAPYAITVGGPNIVALCTYCGFAFANRNKVVSNEVEQIVLAASGAMGNKGN